VPELDLDGLLDEQRAYYRAMAPDYDAAAARDPDVADRPELEAALAEFGPAGDVVELAGGTGSWTASLARHATRLTVVDAAPEVLAINAAKLSSASIAVEYLLADLFTWRPPRRYDVVFFSYWLSHVPVSRFAAFWELVRAALAPGGRVFFLDSARPTRQPFDHVLRDEPERGLSQRRLDDGRRFQVVKVFWDPEDLARRLDALGFQVTVRVTESGHCLYGAGAPSPAPTAG
jgi:ubiquinone/menaquinone biosynthesis C-methylase UbiE